MMVMPVFYLIQLLMLVAARGRWRLSLIFPAYLVWGLLLGLSMVVDKERFWTKSFYMVISGGAELLRLGLGLELAWRTFRLFPGAGSTARKVALAILALTAVAALAVIARPPFDTYETATTLVIPRVQNGTLWLMVATLVVAYWYRVPIHPFHLALLTTFTAYMAIFATLLTLISVRGWAIIPYVYALDSASYALAACWWVHAAWRRQYAVETVHDDTLRKLRLGMMAGAS